MARLIPLLFALVAFAMLPKAYQQAALCLALALILARLAIRDGDARVRVSFLALGLLTPLLPAMGWNALLAFVWIFLLLGPGPVRMRAFSWSLPFVVILSSWVAVEIALQLDPHLFHLARGVFAEGGTRGVADLASWLFSAPPPYVYSLAFLSRILALCLLYDGFRDSVVSRQAFVRGLLIGLPIAALLTALHVTGIVTAPFPNQSPYWESARRPGGTFTDPNAFGVFVALLLPLLLSTAFAARGTRRIAVIGLAATWLVLAAFSGSRTYFVGLFVYAALIAWHRGRRPAFIVAAALAALLAIANGGWLLGVENGRLERWPVGVVRLLRTLDLETMEGSLAHRLYFVRIGWRVWLDNPGLGSGFNTFRSLVPSYARLLSIPTGGWRDNPNGMYLGILAETGIIGLGALLLSIARLSWLPDSAPLSRAPVVALAAMLCTGPWLDFDEIVVLTGCLMAATLRPRIERPPGWKAIAVGAVLLAAIALKSRGGERGLYEWELDGTGHPFRWTGAEAQVIVRERQGPVLALALMDAIPGQHRPDPLAVSIFLDGKRLATIPAPWKSWRRLGLYVPEAATGQHVVRIVPSRTFWPSAYRRRDYRLLGVACQPPTLISTWPRGAYGLYFWERTAEGKGLRWSMGRRAAIAIGPPASKVHLPLITLDPLASSKALRLRISVEDGGIMTVALPDNRWHNVVVPLPAERRPRMVSIESTRTFTLDGTGEPRETSFALGSWTPMP